MCLERISCYNGVSATDDVTLRLGYSRSHIVGRKVSVGEGKGSSYDSVDIELSLSCEGAFGAGTLIGMGSLPRAWGRRREYTMRAPMRLEDLKGVVHGERRWVPRLR